MPELPEVERARRALRPAMEGARFERVIARRQTLRGPLPRDFVARLEGRTVRSLRRRAKYLLADLSSDEILVMHLGMSGSFAVSPAAAPFATHDHVIFEMSSGAVVVFNDPRRFGSMRIVRDEASDPAIGPLGPEPLDAAFDAAALAAAFARRRSSLKAALMDQRVVAGLGNIYVAEALHRARLSPKRLASTLTRRSGQPTPALVRLVAGIKGALEDALKSTREYGDDRFRVYDREGRRCPRRGCPGVIRRIVQQGRSTFYCATCQR